MNRIFNTLLNKDVIIDGKKYLITQFDKIQTGIKVVQLEHVT
jgi:hypothetical protein